MHLMNYETGGYIRQATADELQASIEAAKEDGGAGVILVDGIKCYVIGEADEVSPEDLEAAGETYDQMVKRHMENFNWPGSPDHY